jgi:cellulose synthase/poly-beta-1,6-N-acetylglucosamine synthase-like glycosyltransferase
MLEIIIATVTLISGLLVVYHHALYPIMLRLLSEKRKKMPGKATVLSADWAKYPLPSVTVILPAYNEQRWIAEKIRNLAVLDYPPSLLKVVIACDGCSDQTARVAQETIREPLCRQMNFTVMDYPDNRGKVALINERVQAADSDLIALTDVSALLSIDALKIAAEQFRDLEVGVVNSHYRLWRPGSTGEAVYWRYQSELKHREAALGSTLGTHGACYLFRRDLFEPLAADTINDDFVLPMGIVARGYRSVQEPRITALELEPTDELNDFKRRIRISAGNLQQLLRLKSLLHPRYGLVAFTFASGKGLRVIMPYLMLTALLGSLILAQDSFLFLMLAALQVGLYSLAAWAMTMGAGARNRVLKALGYLVSGHLAGLWGSLRYLLKLERGRWRRVASTE